MTSPTQHYFMADQSKKRLNNVILDPYYSRNKNKHLEYAATFICFCIMMAMVIALYTMAAISDNEPVVVDNYAIKMNLKHAVQDMGGLK